MNSSDYWSDSIVNEDSKHSSNTEQQPSSMGTSNKRTKLYVSNFPENCTRRNLTEFFGKFGQVLECAIMWDTYAFIHYGSMAEAQNALKQASQNYFMGKKLFIQISTSRNRQTCDWYQQEIEKIQREKTQNADDLSSSSSHLSLSPSSSHNLVETKLYVTNLPENCNQQELKALFEPYGNVLECVIMWNHYAFIHFSDLSEAKFALKNLNGYSYHNKNLIVQLSTSSNRPLPKCMVFNNNSNKNNKNKTDQNSQTQQKKASLPPVSSILCYRANDLEKQELESAIPVEKKEINWIQVIKDGCLPVNNKPVANQHLKSIDINQLFSSAKATEKEHPPMINLSDIPTPDMPDWSIKIPSMNPKKNKSFEEKSSNIESSSTVKNNNIIKNDTDCLKNLIRSINESKKSKDFAEMPVGGLDVNDLENERTLIDNLNNLKIETNDSITESVSFNLDLNLKKIWDIEPTQKIDQNLKNLSPSTQSLSSEFTESSISPVSSTNGAEFSYSSSNSPFQPSKDFGFYFEGFDRSRISSTIIDTSINNTRSQQQHSKKPVKLSRCKVVNYILFPELKEQYFFHKKDYDNALLNLLKKACNVEYTTNS